jgi:hypothetical protein
VHEVVPDPYLQRRFRRLPIWQFGAWAFKPYAIDDCADTSGRHVDEQLITAAGQCVAALLPSLEAEEHHSNLGIVLLHHDSREDWLLPMWWIHGDICARLLLRSPLEEPQRFELQSSPNMACVWELAVIDHERRAWIETMMTSSPDPQAYLARRMPDGMY